MKKKIALVCIAKNEDDYIEEWIDYHKKIGFDDIFIFQNNWRCKNTYENVHLIEFDGHGMQQPAYNTFVHNARNHYEWAAFFDVDEFLVLKKHKSIKDFIHDYSDCPAIGINEVLFGNNFLTHKTAEKSVLKRFTRRQNKINQHIKTFIQLNQTFRMYTHHPSIQWYSPERTINEGPFNHQGSTEIAQINHYFCKTQEEFLDKIERGLADNPSLMRTMEEFEPHNYNDIEDIHALQFMYGES
jgi:hypothetical protein